MARGNRRKEGGPEYPLQHVHALAGIHQIHFTRKARDEAAALLPASFALPAAAMRSTLLALREEHWRFSEENDNGWVDVYRIVKFDRLGEAEGGGEKRKGSRHPDLVPRLR